MSWEVSTLNSNLVHKWSLSSEKWGLTGLEIFPSYFLSFIAMKRNRYFVFFSQVCHVYKSWLSLQVKTPCTWSQAIPQYNDTQCNKVLGQKNLRIQPQGSRGTKKELYLDSLVIGFNFFVKNNLLTSLC